MAPAGAGATMLQRFSPLRLFLAVLLSSTLGLSYGCDTPPPTDPPRMDPDGMTPLADSGASARSARPDGVTDLTVVGASANTVTIAFTEVSDGRDRPAQYELRIAPTPMDGWSSGARVRTGDCAYPIQGVAIGARYSCTVGGLEPGRSYDLQLRSFRVSRGSVTWGPLSNRVTARTEAPEPVRVEVSPATATLTVGATLGLRAAALDGSGNPIAATFEWRSSAPGVVSVSGTGVATALAPGRATIEALAGSVSGSATIEVPEPVAITNPGSVQDLRVVASGVDRLTLRFTEVNDGSGAPARYQFRTAPTPLGWGWGSATPVASGSCAGVVEGKAVGSTLECTIEGLPASTSIDVQGVAYRGTLDSGSAVFGALSNIATGLTGSPPPPPPPAEPGRIQILPEGGTIRGVGGTLQLSATAVDANGTPVANPGFNWTSGDPAIATVDAAGRVTARALGSVLVWAAAACCTSDTVTVRVEAASTPSFSWEYLNAPGLPVIAESDWGSISSPWGRVVRYAGADIRIVDDATDPVSPPGVLEFFYPQGLRDGYEPGVVYTSAKGAREVFAGIILKFEEGFSWHALGIKLNLLQTNLGGWLTLGGGGYGGPTGTPPDISVGSRALGFSPEVFPYNVANPPAYTRGQWMKLEWHARINDPGMSNGIVTLWINGVRVTDYRNVRFPEGTTGFVEFQHAGTWGGGGSAVPQDQSFFIARTLLTGR